MVTGSGIVLRSVSCGIGRGLLPCFGQLVAAVQIGVELRPDPLCGLFYPSLGAGDTVLAMVKMVDTVPKLNH